MRAWLIRALKSIQDASFFLLEAHDEATQYWWQEQETISKPEYEIYREISYAILSICIDS